MNKKIFLIVLIIIGVMLLYFLLQPSISDLYYGYKFQTDFSEYQEFSGSYVPDFNKTAYIIINKDDEAEKEKEYGISIDDGIDYDQYSLILSINYKIDKFYIMPNIHPNRYFKNSKENQVRVCETENEEYHENMIFLYLVKEKNIVCGDEYEDTFF
jgi:hypothetical protein